MEETTKAYQAPQIEVFEIEVERGFANSYTGGNENLGDRKDDFGW